MTRPSSGSRLAFVALSVSATFITLGCAPAPILGAAQVGGAEPAAWVYIKSEDRRENGVYRCVDTPQGALCHRAKMSD